MYALRRLCPGFRWAAAPVSRATCWPDSSAAAQHSQAVRFIIESIVNCFIIKKQQIDLADKLKLQDKENFRS